jgi:hypothetical protein
MSVNITVKETRAQKRERLEREWRYALEKEKAERVKVEKAFSDKYVENYEIWRLDYFDRKDYGVYYLALRFKTHCNETAFNTVLGLGYSIDSICAWPRKIDIFSENGKRGIYIHVRFKRRIEFVERIN